MRGHSILSARLANAENYLLVQFYLRCIDRTAVDGHDRRASDRLRMNVEQRRLDWLAHEELWRTA